VNSGQLTDDRISSTTLGSSFVDRLLPKVNQFQGVPHLPLRQIRTETKIKNCGDVVQRSSWVSFKYCLEFNGHFWGDACWSTCGVQSSRATEQLHPFLLLCSPLLQHPGAHLKSFCSGVVRILLQQHHSSPSQIITVPLSKKIPTPFLFTFNIFPKMFTTTTHPIKKMCETTE